MYQPGKAYWDVMRRVEHHVFLRNFYESWVPYTEEFEQMHDIIKEELGEVASTAVFAKTFRMFTEYHKALQKDPNAIYRENVQVRLPAPEPIKPLVELVPDFHNLALEKQNETRAEITDAYIEEMRVRNTPKYEVRDVMWSEDSEMIKRCIIGALVNPEIGREGMPKVVFASIDKYIYELKAGDPMLIK